MTQGTIKIDSIVRSRRKTVALILNKQGELVVRAPLGVPFSVIEELVLEKSAWIRSKKEFILDHMPAPRQLVPGETLPFLGQEYPLLFSHHSDDEVRLEGNIIVNPEKGPVRELLVKWYRREAKEILEERCEHWAALSGLKPVAIRITSARKRWGSCSSSGNLNFTWRLVMAPIEIIDYVVVHELVHLDIRNHSRSFWDRVGSILPDYGQRRKKLTEKSSRYFL